MKRPTYGWTFAFLILLMVVACVAYVMASGEMFSIEYFSVVTLVGCVLIIMKLTINIMLFEKGNSTTLQRDVPLMDVAAVTCPDFWTRITDENSQKPRCVNNFPNGTTIGSIDTLTVDLEDGSKVEKKDSVWAVTFCDSVKSDVRTFPRTTASKLCEYLGRTS